MGNSGQRQFLQRIGRRRRPRRRGSFPTAACNVPYRQRCRRRPIRGKNCRCPELPTCPEFPPFTLSMRATLIDGWVTKRGPLRCRFFLPERSRFSQIGHIIVRALVALKASVPFTCRFVARSSRIKVEQTDTQTHRRTDQVP